MAEEDDGTGLKDLIKHHKSRPSYARMISWEFSRTDNTAEKKSRQRRRSKKDRGSQSLEEQEEKDNVVDVEECNNDSSSGESEYHSAEEELVNSESELPSLSVSTSGSDDESSVFTSSFRTCSTHSGNMGDDMILGSTYESKPITRKRAPSKKQKRKRREQQQNTFFLEDLPFANLQEYDFLGEEISDLVIVQKAVPSLADLCIRATRNLDSAIKKMVPKSLNASMSHVNEKFYVEKIQLSWIYQFLEEVGLEENSYILQFSYYGQNEKKFFIPTRNVWNIHFIHQLQSYSPVNRDQGRGSVKSFFLPFTHAVNYQFLSGYQGWHNIVNYSVASVLSVLGTVVDLMLPQTVNLPIKTRKRNQSGDQEIIAQRTLVAFDRVKAVLKARYPRIIDICWDNIVPYVFWARGDVSHATKAFRKLIDSEKRARFKAMYLYEIGRLHNMFDDQSMAQDCIRECVEYLYKKPIYNDEVISRQIEHQSKLIKANLYDQGVMNADKAWQAHSAWMTCFHTPKDKTFQSLDHYFLMDSFFCFHSGTWEDPTKSWLDEALSKLQTMCPEYPGLYFYQSLVYALQGKEKEAEAAYRDFRRRSSDDTVLPGQYVSDEMPNPKSAWQNLAQTVKLQGKSPIPLHVLWRTQLSPPRLYDRGFSLDGIKEYGTPLEADACSKELNLRFNRDGYITGDMMLQLPPIRGIHLHPFTGSLILNQVPGETEVWKSLEAISPNKKNDPTNLEEIDFSCIPRLTELYRDNMGNTVSLLFANSRSIERINKVKPICQLHWKGSTGPRAKINVVVKCRDQAYESFKKESAELSITSEEMRKERIVLMKQSYDKGWKLPKAANHDEISCYLRDKYKSPTSKNKNSKSKVPRKVYPFKGAPYRFSLEKPPLVFGKTILLFIDLDGRKFTMFVNCESRRDFLEFHLEHNSSLVTGKSFPIPRSVWSKADVMYVNQSSSFMVYDKFGQEFDRVDEIMVEDKVTPLVLKNRFFYVHKGTGFLNSSCNGDAVEIEMYGKIRSFQEIGEMLVLLTENNIVFIEAASTLPIPVVEKSLSPLSIPLVDGSLQFPRKFNKFVVLGEKMFEETPTKRFMRAALAIDNHLVILKTDVNTFERDVEDFDPVTVTASLAISGQAQEVCFLSEQGGFLASVSQYFKKESQFYRENLYHYAHSGQLLGVLVNLGPGSRSFLPRFYTQEGTDPIEGSVTPGWHVYMRDGHDGIICVRLKL